MDGRNTGVARGEVHRKNMELGHNITHGQWDSVRYHPQIHSNTVGSGTW